MNKKRRGVCVFSASSTKIAEHFNDAARSLGRILASKNLTLINGAGRCGLMGECSDACLEAGGRVTGVIPQFMVEQNWHHTSLTELIITKDMHERKETMARISDGVIALPGGVGTIEELMEVITWKQLSLYLNPIVILNQRGYYDDLLNMLEKTVSERFMGNVYRGIWSVAQTPEEAVDMFIETPLWNPEIRKYAAL